MMSDKEFAELELRATICPQQCRWPKPEYVHWQSCTRPLMKRAVSVLLHDDIAGKHRADLVLELQSAVRELRIAHPENPVGTKLLTELSLHRCLHVDVGEDAEDFALQRFGHARNP